jgi:putative heme-binding domain-containing protein
VLGLAKVNEPDACQAALQALALLQKSARQLREFEQARDTFLNAPRLDQQHALLQSLAEQLAGPKSVWAEAALLGLSVRGSPESRESVSQSLAQGWAEPRRRVQILQAVALARFRPYRERVLAALADPDRSVAMAAKKTADELRFQTDSKPAGPRIETLDPAAVVAAVVKEKGDRLLGEDLFTRLNCSKCHTVRADEPLRGPFLGTIAATYKRRDLAESVLIPSKSIAQGFATNQFLLDDGRTLMGFVSQEAADKVTIRDLEGKEIEIPTASIEERAKLPLSMMPEGLVKSLTVKELASLLDYLESLPKK